MGHYFVYWVAGFGVGMGFAAVLLFVLLAVASTHISSVISAEERNGQR